MESVDSLHHQKMQQTKQHAVTLFPLMSCQIQDCNKGPNILEILHHNGLLVGTSQHVRMTVFPLYTNELLKQYRCLIQRTGSSISFWVEKVIDRICPNSWRRILCMTQNFFAMSIRSLFFLIFQLQQSFVTQIGSGFSQQCHMQILFYKKVDWES